MTRFIVIDLSIKSGEKSIEFSLLLVGEQDETFGSDKTLRMVSLKNDGDWIKEHTPQIGSPTGFCAR